MIPGILVDECVIVQSSRFPMINVMENRVQKPSGSDIRDYGFEVYNASRYCLDFIKVLPYRNNGPA